MRYRNLRIRYNSIPYSETRLLSVAFRLLLVLIPLRGRMRHGVEGESQTCGTALKYLGLAALSAKIKGARS
jgi:hypothetical protein